MRTAAAAAVLVTTLLAVGAGEGPAQAPAAMKPVARNLLIAAQAIDDLTKGQPLAIIATRAASDAEPALAAQAKYLAHAGTLALLRCGVRGLDAEAGRPLTIAYRDHKLPGGVLFTAADATHWVEKKRARFVLQSTLTAAAERLALSWQLIDLVRLQPVRSIDLPPIPVAEIAGEPALDLLPEINARLLLHAGNHIGEQLGRGECWDLPASWLNANGHRVSNYDFGREVAIEQALPGDVLTIDTNGFHHVMLLLEPRPDLKSAPIYHQNVNGMRVVISDTFPAKMRAGIKVWRPGRG